MRKNEILRKHPNILVEINPLAHRVSQKKLDEFKTCMFPVVLATEPRIRYQLKACLTIFTLRADPTLRATLTENVEDIFAVTPVSLDAQFSPAQRDLRRNAAHGGGTQSTTEFTASVRSQKLLGLVLYT